MSPPSYFLVATEHFLDQTEKLPEAVYNQLQKAIQLLENNPRHPSLRTHEVKHATGEFGGKIFEAYINKQYRFTWEYGLKRGEIVLRNADDHDECLENP